jgi:hypothetical protein
LEHVLDELRKIKPAAARLSLVVGYAAAKLQGPGCGCGETMEIRRDDGLVAQRAADEDAIDVQWVCRICRTEDAKVRLRYWPATGQVRRMVLEADADVLRVIPIKP